MGESFFASMQTVVQIERAKIQQANAKEGEDLYVPVSDEPVAVEEPPAPKTWCSPKQI